MKILKICFPRMKNTVQVYIKFFCSCESDVDAFVLNFFFNNKIHNLNTLIIKKKTRNKD